MSEASACNAEPEDQEPELGAEEWFIEPGMKEAWEAKWQGSINSFCKARNLGQGNFSRWLRGKKQSRSFLNMMREYLANAPDPPASLESRIQELTLQECLDHITQSMNGSEVKELNFITEELPYSKIRDLDQSKFWVICRLDSSRRLKRGRIGNIYFMLSRSCSQDSIYHTLIFELVWLNRLLHQDITFNAIGKSDLADTVVYTFKLLSDRKIHWIGTQEEINELLA